MQIIEETVRINLGGPKEIEISTLMEVLDGTLKSLTAATDDIVDDNTSRKIVVRSFEEGSFEILIATIIQAMPQILPIFSNGLNIFKTALDLRVHLKGSDPQKIEYNGNGTVNVINIQNSTIVIDKNLYESIANRPEIEVGMTKIFKALDEDNDRTTASFLLNSNNNEQDKIILSSDEISYMSKKIDLAKGAENIEENQMQTYIKIIKADFECNTKWKFYLNGVSETAYIEDETFLSDVKAGKYLFGSLTTMEVILRSRYKIGKDGIPVSPNKIDYTILKVVKVINNEHVQQKIFE